MKKNCPISERRKKRRILSCLWLSWFFRSRKEDFVGVRADVSRREPRLLRSCHGVEISIRIPSEATFLEVCYRTTSTSKKSLQKWFHAEACALSYPDRLTQAWSHPYSYSLPTRSAMKRCAYQRHPPSTLRDLNPRAPTSGHILRWGCTQHRRIAQ